MNTSKHVFDVWLDRGMKLAGIGGFCWAAFLFITGVVGIPPRIALLEAAVGTQEAKTTTNHEEILAIQKDIQYIKESVTLILKKTQ